MSDLHAQIRAYVEDTIERIDSDDVVAAVSLQPVVTNRAGWYARPTWVAAGAAVLVLIGVGLPVLFFGGDESPVADQPATTIAPTVPTVTNPTAVTDPTMVAVAVPMIWHRVPDDGVFANSSILAVVAGGPGLVAGGIVFDSDLYLDAYLDAAGPPPASAAIWVSEDGAVWQRIDDSMLFAGKDNRFDSVVRDIAAGPLGFVAVGSHGFDAAVWISPDGLSWTRVVDDDLGSGGSSDGLQSIGGVTAGGPGWVAVGDGDFDALVWVSSDGLEWTLITDEDLLGGDMVHADLYDVTLSGPRLVAVGSIGLTEGTGDTAQQAAIWTSEDGLDWQRLPNDSFAGDRVFESITGDPTSDRLITFGTPKGIWHSSDGREWIMTERPLRLGGPAPSSGVAWDGDRLVAAGRDLAISVWVSLDGGLNWHRIEPETDTFAADDVARDVVLHGSRFIAVGEATSRPGEPPAGAVWIGEWSDQ
jgi:hypothetical protein